MTGVILATATDDGFHAGGAMPEALIYGDADIG